MFFFFKVLELGHPDILGGRLLQCFGPDRTFLRLQEFEHRLQIIDDKHADLQVSFSWENQRWLDRQNHPALEEVLAKKKGKILLDYDVNLS